MKYYIGNIDEQYGEFEVEQSFLFATAGDANLLMEQLAKEWYEICGALSNVEHMVWELRRRDDKEEVAA